MARPVIGYDISVKLRGLPELRAVAPILSLIIALAVACGPAVAQERQVPESRDQLMLRQAQFTTHVEQAVLDVGEGSLQ